MCILAVGRGSCGGGCCTDSKHVKLQLSRSYLQYAAVAMVQRKRGRDRALEMTPTCAIKIAMKHNFHNLAALSGQHTYST